MCFLKLYELDGLFYKDVDSSFVFVFWYNILMKNWKSGPIIPDNNHAIPDLWCWACCIVNTPRQHTKAANTAKIC